jgi:hypothetical protein
MTVAEMIQQLQDLCDGRDPATVEVRKEVTSDDMWGSDYEYFTMDSIGGNDYPLMILIK